MKYKNFKYFNGICQLVILILFVGLLIGCTRQDNSALERGRNFPEESQLHYSEGIFIAYEVIESIPSGKGSRIITNIRLTLRNPLTKDDTEFYCTYTAYRPSGGSCPKELNLSNYNYQQGRIGWYYQDDFMGYHNPYPQVVTVQIGDKKILTYDYTRTYIDEINKRVRESNIILSSIMISVSAVFFSLFVFVFFYIAAKGKKKNESK